MLLHFGARADIETNFGETPDKVHQEDASVGMRHGKLAETWLTRMWIRGQVAARAGHKELAKEIVDAFAARRLKIIEYQR